MRSTDYEFVSSDSSTLLTNLISKYEIMTGRTLEPASPDRLFLSWIADILIHERVNQNYIGNQNIPSRAEGEKLDSLGEWIYNLPRNPAQPAKVSFFVLLFTSSDWIFLVDAPSFMVTPSALIESTLYLTIPASATE